MFAIALVAAGLMLSQANMQATEQAGFVDCVRGTFPVLDAPNGKHFKDVGCKSRITVTEFSDRWVKVRLQDGSEGYMTFTSVSKDAGKWVPFGRPLHDRAVEGSTAVAQAYVAPKYEKQGTGVAVFKQKFDKVWASIVEALSANNLRPQTMDRASGAIFLQTDASWGSVWGSANSAVSLFTNKRVGRMSSWVGIAAEGNIYIKAVDDTRTQIQITMRFAGCNGFAGSFVNAQCAWEALQTNGALEDRIIQAVADRLPALSTAELYPASKPDEKVIDAAKDVLMAATKVEEAFELGAATDRLMSQLIDARAAFKLYSGSNEAKVLPRFTDALGAALDDYRDALNASGDDRAKAVATAQSEADKAKQCLRNYRTYVQEAKPKREGP